MKWKLWHKKENREIDTDTYSIDADGRLLHYYDDNACGDPECCGPNHSGTVDADDSWEGGGIAREDIEIIYEK